MKQLRMKKGLLWALLLILVLSQLNFTFASEVTFDYVALGDSIPNGVSYEYSLRGGIIDSYTDKLSRDIDARPEYKVAYTDLTKSGGKSIDVLKQVQDPLNKNSIASAELITLCIGANDLMDAARRTLLGSIDFYSIDWFKAELGRQSFEANWPKIITEIKRINPNAKLVVMTVYNPYNISDNKIVSGVHIRNKVDSLMTSPVENKGINTIIKENASPLNYKVVDVYSLFESKYGNTKKNVTGFYGLIIKDPHPDKNGQIEIFNLHKLGNFY